MTGGESGGGGPEDGASGSPLGDIKLTGYSRSPKNPTLPLLQKSSKSATTAPQLGSLYHRWPYERF